MNSQGLTLVELMIVVAVLAILSALAVPSFSEMLRRQHISGQVNALFSMVYMARSEAIKRNTVVTVCKSLDGENCGGDWSDGWLMFADPDADGERSASETSITTGEIAENTSVSWTAFGSDNYLRFSPQGLTLAQNGTFRVCDKQGVTKPRAVVVSKTARVRTPPAGEDTNGDALNCSD